MMKSTHNKRAFTLIELLVSMGVIGVLAGIVVTAVSPQRQLVVANDAKRQVAANEIEKALQRYIVSLPGQPTLIDMIPETEVPICKPNAVLNPGEECFNLNFLEEYLTEIPVDIDEPATSNYTGFWIQKDTNGWLTVISEHHSDQANNQIGSGTTGDGQPCVAGGVGTVGEPIVICDCTQLQAMEEDLEAHYLLGRNIDCSETAGWDGGQGFRPVGTYPDFFSGSLEGEGYTISDLTINRPAENYVGLFGNAPGVVVANLTMTNASVVGKDYVGAVGGTVNVDGCTITGSVTGVSRVGGAAGVGGAANSTATVNVTGAGYGVGGLIGSAGSASGYDDMIITNSSAHGNVNVLTGSPTSNVGGLVGSIVIDHYDDFDNYMAVQRSYATGNVTATAPGGTHNVGGLIGYLAEGTAQDVYATGNVTSNGNDVGGLIGDMYEQTPVIRAYSSGNVSGNIAGGLIGVQRFSLSNVFTVSQVVNGSVYDAAVTAYITDDVIAELPDYNPPDPFNTVYWNDTVGSPDYCYLVHDGAANQTDDGCTRIDNNIAAFYDASLDVYDTGLRPWDFATIWQTNPGALPTLR